MAISKHNELEPELLPELLDEIRVLADEAHRSMDDVNKLYVETFEQLSSDARIKDYLVLLTSKKVRDELRHSGKHV
jgi:hypothetical protein